MRASSTASPRRCGKQVRPSNLSYTPQFRQWPTADDTIVDAPVSFGSYTPGNYDGKYEGTITIRRALGDSRNIPAVKTLAKLGVHNLIPYLRRFGITSKIDPVLPIALGAADVTLIEMVSAYSTFPNDGVRVVPQMIQRVQDFEGNVLEENFPDLRDVIRLKPPASWSISCRSLSCRYRPQGSGVEAPGRWKNRHDE
jgi:penicillin-binding protein 1A